MKVQLLKKKADLGCDVNIRTTAVNLDGTSEEVTLTGGKYYDINAASFDGRSVETSTIADFTLTTGTVLKNIDLALVSVIGSPIRTYKATDEPAPEPEANTTKKEEKKKFFS